MDLRVFFGIPVLLVTLYGAANGEYILITNPLSLDLLVCNMLRKVASCLP